MKFWIFAIIYINLGIEILVLILLIWASLFIIWKINNEILFFCFFISSMWLLDTSNLTSVWLLIEMQTLSLILIMYLNEKTSYLNLESIFKYTIISAIFSILILIYIINEYNENNIFFIKSYSMISVITIIAFSVKIGIFPFHVWIPEVYLGINLNSIFILGLIPKIIMFLLWSKIYLTNNILYVMIFSSLIFSCVAGLNQSNFKLIIAYSSIYNISFIFLSFFISNNLSNTYSWIYFAIYFFSSTVLIMSIKKVLKNDYVIYLNNIDNKVNILMIITLFSLIGIPPLAGFFIKVFFIKYIIYKKMILLSIVIILTTLVSSFYYLRIVKVIYDLNVVNLNQWSNLSSKIKSYSNEYIILFSFYFIAAIIYNPNFLIIIINYIYL